MQATGRSAPFVVLFCAALYLFTLTRELEFPRAPGRLGPDVWPQAILLLLMLACIVGIGHNFLAGRRPAAPAQPEEERTTLTGDVVAQQPSVPPRYWLVTGGFLLFLLYPVALEYLGFPVATFVFMALFMLVGQWLHVPGVLIVSAIGALSLFYVFRGLVYVSLPLGAGPFQSVTLWLASLLGVR
jgi:putative tricarboxylic transport membrane protein